MHRSYYTLVFIFSFDFFQDWFNWTYLFTLFASITLPVCAFGILWRIWHSMGPVLTALYNNSDCLSCFHIIFLILSCTSLFSNSYIVEEAHMQTFFIISSLMLYMVQNGFIFKSKKHFILALSLLAFVRATKIYFRCREEQQGYCTATDFHKAIGNFCFVSSNQKGRR